jgi:hypothetical protein
MFFADSNIICFVAAIVLSSDGCLIYNTLHIPKYQTDVIFKWNIPLNTIPSVSDVLVVIIITGIAKSI